MTESHVEFPVRVFLFAIGSTAIFALMNVFGKLAAEEANIAQIVFFRNLLAFLPLMIFIGLQGGLKLLRTDNHIGHFWRGSIGIISMACFFLSFAMLPMANATAIHFVSPLILTILSIPMLGEKVGWPRWTAVVIGLGGVLFMVLPEAGDGGNFWGIIAAFGAAFFAAFAMIFVRKLGRTEHALAIVFYFTLYGTVLGGLASVFMWEPLSQKTLMLLALVGLMGGVGQTLLTYAYSLAPAAYVAPFTYTAMLFAVGADVLVWGVWPGWHIYAGSFIIIGSGLFILFREAQKKRQLALRASVYAVPPAGPG